MSDELPLPLVPPETDLRAYPFTPIFRARLFGSAFHAKVTDSEWRAGVTLWLKSWDQVPAGTLPDDEIELCRLAELGRDRRAWAKVRGGALHGWCKSADGRLHHAVVAEGVREAWEKRNKASAKGKAGASKRWSTGNATTNQNHSTGIARAMPGDSNREGDREGRENNPPKPPLGARHKKLNGHADEFERWYAVYPHKVGRGAAERVFPRALELAGSVEILIEATKRYIQAKPADRSWCNPATWLNQKRWLDHPAPTENATARTGMFA